MRHVAQAVLLVILALGLPGRAPATDWERIISHENPLFKPEVARLTVGQDGAVYLTHPGKASQMYCYMLRMSRTGADMVGVELPFGDVATANKRGVIALAQPGYGGNRVGLFDAEFRPLGGVDGFDRNGYNPVHVEAGASGDFYALDDGRKIVVRLSPAGKQLAAYPLPDGQPKEKSKRTYRDFRVCEKAKAFYLFPHPNPGGRIICIGFDGKERWVYDGRIPVTYTAEGSRVISAFDVDEAGKLYALDGESVRILDPDGKGDGEVKLKLGDAKSGLSFLRVYGEEILLKRSHPTELFRSYDHRTGELLRVVSTRHERMTVSFGDGIWSAGKSVPVKISLTAGERTLAPRWRVWARPFASVEYREFPVKEGAIQVPTDCCGLYLIKVTAEVQPWLRGATCEHLIRAVVEIRQPGTNGSATVLTPDNRSYYGRGEEIPFRVALRGAEAGRVAALTVSLTGGSGTIASEKAEAKGDEVLSFRVSEKLTARLKPGHYTLTVAADGLSCSGQPLTIGPGLRTNPFHVVQHGDYEQLYPCADVWDAPDLIAAHAARTAKLGANLMVDRIGCGAQLTNLEGPRLTWDAPNLMELEALAKSLRSRDGGVAPERATMAAPLPMTLAAYGSSGIEQMATLLSMDAGLPLGKPYDQRKPNEFTRDLTRVTRAMAPYPSFRGWSWATNWWHWSEGGDSRGPLLRASAAGSIEERSAYVAAWKRAQEKGEWSDVFGKVADIRLGYAVKAQELFNKTLRNLSPKKVTAVSGPYRALELYPPLSFREVDEVQLHVQAEQLQWPHIAPHNVDYQKRPGKPAWGHPELFNEAGTGDQALPSLFQMVMRGADGVGCAGAIPNWGPQPEDARSGYQGTASVYRAAFSVLKQYGPWLTTLENNDRVAIVVSGRMCRLDEWSSIGGRYFTRLFEAYQSCLRAHRPARFVFVEDLGPGLLKRYKAVLVVGQTVEMEPDLDRALREAKDAGVAILHDGTCRAALVKDFKPLGVSFDKVEKDPSAWQDDTAYLRFPGYYAANRDVLVKALGKETAVAELDNPEVLLSERAAEQGRYLFLVNDTPPDLDPGQLWRVTLAIAARIPVMTPVRLREPGEAVYDVFALKRVFPAAGVVRADLRSLPARLYAILPAAIAHVDLRGPKQAMAGQPFSWSAAVQDADGKPIKASVPLRLRLLDADGRVLDERFTSAASEGVSGSMYALLGAAKGTQTLEATELFSGLTARLEIAVDPPDKPASLSKDEPPDTAKADARSRGPVDKGKGLVAAEELFGPHLRDLVVSGDGKLAVASAMNWDHNLYAVDVITGELRWRQRAGHYFAFAPQALLSGIAVQGYDLNSAEGYHLYLVRGNGELERRFALYGLPKRLPHRFVSGAFYQDRINNFAVSPDGNWVASAGDLGLAVWSRKGELLWSRDSWKSSRHTATLAALAADTLLSVEGTELTAHEAATGKQRWQVRLPAGECVRLVVSADGKSCAVQASDGRIYVVRQGKVLATLAGNATVKNLRHAGSSGTGRAFGVNGVALSPDGSMVAVAAGNHLKLYSVADGLCWVLPADDTLHGPRFSADSKRLAVGSSLGSLYVMSAEGDLLLERDLGALPVPAFLPDGDLVIGTWMGTMCRLDTNYAELWRTRLSPGEDVRNKLTAHDGAPTTRIAFLGNAEEKPAALKPNLLDPKNAFVKLQWADRNGQVQNGVLFAHDSASLIDGTPDAPPAPWISWPQMNWYAEGDPSTYVVIDTYRTQLRVHAITLVEDAARPYSWLRDAAFEYWDAAKERWVFVQPLLSDAAMHTHKFSNPVEAARFRIALPKMLCGNLRLAKIVLHGEKLGPSHPDAAAKRPRAVLFDEGNDLNGYLQKATIAFKGAYAGERCLTVGAEDAVAVAPWPEGMKVFGETLPNWDFEIVEDPRPGQYRYLQFAWKTLTPATKGICLRMSNGTHDAVSLYAGQRPPGEVPNPKQMADRPPQEWTVVRVDLWEVFKRPVRIRAMRLASPGGSAAFDQIVLGQTEKDLPPQKK